MVPVGVPRTALAQQLVEFDLQPGSEPRGITRGPDGNLWVAERLGNRIARISPAGSISEFSIPTPDSEPLSIVAGPDGNLWFTESVGNRIGRITPSSPNTVTEFPLPTADSLPCSITVGPDGNLWFAQCNASRIGRITTSGVTVEFTLTYGGRASSIAIGPGGDDLWFTDSSLDKIGRFSPADPATVTLFTAHGAPSRITAGPDGNLWFAEAIGNRIGRLTPTGVVTEFAIPTASSLPDGVVAGPDGNVWFTERFGSRVGRVTPSGAITEFAAHDGPATITVGPDGNLWFTERVGSRIGRFTPPPALACAPNPQIGCRRETASQKGSLLLKNQGGKGKDRFAWKWLKGEETAVEDLGFPEVLTDYAMCIYDESNGTPTLVAEATAPLGGICAGKPCWTAIGGQNRKGVSYKAPKGFLKITARAGDAGKASVAVTGAGVNLALPALPLHQDSKVTAQLSNSDGACWEADYSAPASQNDGLQFKAKND